MYKRTSIMLFWMALASLSLAMEVPISLETLAAKSDRIVRGKVVSVTYTHGTNPYGDELIYTHATIRVAESLKGDRSDITVTVEGGTLQGITLTVSDAAEFRAGEEVLVFVKKNLQDYTPLTGFSSKYTILKGGKLLENGKQYGLFRTEILRALRERSVHL